MDKKMQENPEVLVSVILKSRSINIFHKLYHKKGKRGILIILMKEKVREVMREDELYF